MTRHACGVARCCLNNGSVIFFLINVLRSAQFNVLRSAHAQSAYSCPYVCAGNASVL